MRDNALCFGQCMCLGIGGSPMRLVTWLSRSAARFWLAASSPWVAVWAACRVPTCRSSTCSQPAGPLGKEHRGSCFQA